MIDQYVYLLLSICGKNILWMPSFTFCPKFLKVSFKVVGLDSTFFSSFLFSYFLSSDIYFFSSVFFSLAFATDSLTLFSTVVVFFSSFFSEDLFSSFFSAFFSSCFSSCFSSFFSTFFSSCFSSLFSNFFSSCFSSFFSFFSRSWVCLANLTIAPLIVLLWADTSSYLTAKFSVVDFVSLSWTAWLKPSSPIRNPVSGWLVFFIFSFALNRALATISSFFDANGVAFLSFTASSFSCYSRILRAF